jgi:hypothetical protein
MKSQIDEKEKLYQHERKESQKCQNDYAQKEIAT